MSALQFINMLENKGLLDPESIEELHRQVEQSKGRVTPEAIARVLVENQQLTRFQATKLVTELKEQLGDSPNDPSVALRGGRPLESSRPEHDSVEDLLPPEDDESEDGVVEAEIVEDMVEVVPPSVRDRSNTSSGVDSNSMAEVSVAKVRKPKDKIKKSPWESFGIVGVSFILLLLIIFFVPLYIWFSRGSAKEEFAIAEELYNNRDYERAIKQYDKFSSTFTSDDNVSVAKVKSTLSKVRQDAERNADPSIALKTAQEELPKIVNESGLPQLRVDITDTLLRIAEKFISKADNTAGIEDRKGLIALMSQQMELIDDPRFVGTQERTQNDLRIRRIREDQQRVVREIQRSEDLAAALVNMKQGVEAKDVNKAYELRRELVRKYPQLETDPKLTELMLAATSIQRDLVTRASSIPETSNIDSLPSSSNRALLTSRVGEPIATGNQDVVFLRIKGSAVAIRVATGEVLWRKYIGRDWDSDPLRVAQTSDSDPIISVAARGTVSRLSAKDGSLIWESKFEDRILTPQVDGEEIFVATVGGTVVCLDAITGQSRWAKKIPQNIDVGTGGAPGKRKRYLAGNQSNVYVLSRGNGECEEVLYVGHNPGTIVVPPIWVLNQLILFENAGPDYCLMRVYSTNDEGLELTAVQSPVRFKGHVVVEPQLEGRRLAVATNLGEIAILDVEITNAKDKVFKMVNLVSNESVPRVTWPVMKGTDLWLASNRLAYFQIQITGQKLNSMWLKEDADEFTSRPIRIGDLLIHSRVVRGNAGVRVAAVDPTSGNPFWETDIGNPVANVSSSPSGLLAITSQGATYSLDDQSFTASTPTMSIENMGRNQRSMLFANPTPLSEGKSVMLNTSQGSQLLLADPDRKSSWTTKLVNLDLAESYPIAAPLAVGNSLIIPLENAQLVMLDPESGLPIGTPFQPTIAAGERPIWLNPVLLSDNQSVVIADQKRNLYKLSTGKQLRLLNAQPLERSLKGRLAVMRDVVVGVSPGASGDHLDFYETGEFKRIADLNFEGRFAWGPYVMDGDSGSIGFALSDIEGLVAFSSDGKKLWNAPLSQMVLVGRPVLVDGDVLLAGTMGELVRVSLADGKVLARGSAGEPISGTPRLIDGMVVVPGDEGTLIKVPVPSSDGATASGASQ